MKIRWLCSGLVSASLLGLLAVGCGGSDDSAATATPNSNAGTGGTTSAGGSGGGAGAAGEMAGAGGGTTIPQAVVDLRADNNRNGVIDDSDPTEDDQEDTWDNKHGAIFMANIDDDEKTCPKSSNDEALAACNDAADEKVNGDTDLLDMAPLKLKAWPEAPEGVTAKISLSAKSTEAGKEQELALKWVRLFKKSATGEYTVFNPDTDVLSAEDLKAGVDLYLEGKNVIRDSAVFDGFVDVAVTIEDGAGWKGGTDKVRMRLAPVILYNHTQPAIRAWATRSGSNKKYLTDMLAAVDASNNGTKFEEVTSFSYDIWTQDYFETGYMTMPGADGKPHVIRAYVRAASSWGSQTGNTLRAAGSLVFSRFRGPDAAGIQQYAQASLKSNWNTLDSHGNLEVIPPYSYNGKDYPFGRVFRGNVQKAAVDPSFQKMLDSQGAQPHVFVDTSWLLVGHVDETISFVTSPGPRGWKMLANDATMAKKMLQDQVDAGNGGTMLHVGKQWPNSAGSGWVPADISIQDLLNDAEVMASSNEAIVEVDAQLAILKEATGLADDEILHVPFLHTSTYGASMAYQPGMVNGVALSDTIFASPDPFGPVIGGKDIFKTAMETELAKAGKTVKWVDDFMTYHINIGEIHCGSNVERDISNTKNWWENWQ
jgi:protein-arginine deiminase